MEGRGLVRFRALPRSLRFVPQQLYAAHCQFVNLAEFLVAHLPPLRLYKRGHKAGELQNKPRNHFRKAYHLLFKPSDTLSQSVVRHAECDPFRWIRRFDEVSKRRLARLA